MENWREIDGFENYMVSSLGRVKNCDTGQILKPAKDAGGYYRLNLAKDGKSSTHKLHRLVAEAFLDEPKNADATFVDHINRKRSDNNFENLRWTTRNQNNQNACKRQNAKGSKYKGLTYSKAEQKYGVRLTLQNGVRKHFGYFVNEKDGARAYNNAVKKYQPDYGVLNEISDSDVDDSDIDSDSD